MDPLEAYQNHQMTGGPGIGTEDRRSGRRYLIGLNVRWKVLHGKGVSASGTGTTVDLSSGGLLFETTRELHVGGTIQLSIAWPVLLRNVAPLQLIVVGEVVRVTGRRVGVRMLNHEFRTVGIALERRMLEGMVAERPSHALHPAHRRSSPKDL